LGLRRRLAGEPVTWTGSTINLAGAICAPAPPSPPRVVIGAGGSRTTLARGLEVAHEINVYADESLLAEAREARRGRSRPIAISVFLSWEWDKWPADASDEVRRWEDLGGDRPCVSLGADDMARRIDLLAATAG
jgi:alkanesulfonate monooxygenase SsuD/methylene tetrahydromethanopterin reductase-like flavin-dependent oxidoreductase (luciferase family)